MAVVYQVHDDSTKRKLALKRLLPRGSDRNPEKVRLLFEHEYHTLSQLAHPRVIAVHDYGIDDEGPFYTMEVLEGGNLRERSPLPWKDACAVLMDVCSALSLLHSRRQVHRDLTPRNVHCALDGTAKLIDFGAMVPMGPSKQLVGTPAFTAPEVVHSQALDARTDLYSLGATAYFVLTGRNAYPATSFAELRSHWRSLPRPPSIYVEDIPKELDQLVMSLISLDPLGRPTNAVEVMERLSAIAGLTIDEQLVASHAYLSTPTLVGRNDQLLRVRKLMLRALGSRGGTVMIEGDEGVGRSRFLDACVLEGKLAGATVLRAEASDSHTGDWGVVRTILLQLLEALPELALPAIQPRLPVLGHLSSELIQPTVDARRRGSRPPGDAPETSLPSDPAPDGTNGSPVETAPEETGAESPGVVASGDPRAEVWRRGRSVPPPPPESERVELESFDSPHQLRPRLQSVLRDFLLEIGRQRCLLLAVDDLHEIDEPSAAFLAFLAHEVASEKIVVAVTRRTGASGTSPVALKLLSETGAAVKLRNLTLEHTEELLGSVFGDAPNLKLLSDRLYAMTGGNPRAIMQLAEELVDKGVVRQATGSWTLPSRIEARDFPATLGEAIRAAIEKLGSQARQLAQTIALSPERSFCFEECRLLTEHGDPARTMRYLDELLCSKVLSSDGEFYGVSHQGWVDELLKKMDGERQRALHLRLAALFETREHEGFRVAQHLLRAGEEERALDALLRVNQENRDRFEKSAEHRYSYVQSLPRDWVETFESLRGVCARLARPKSQAFWLHRDFVNHSIVKDASSKASLVELIRVLYHLSALADYHELPATLEPSERLKRALELCQQRHDAAPGSEKVLSPFEAIFQLVQAVVLAIKIAGTAFDHPLIAGVPSLEPLVPLTPALWVAEINARSTSHLTAARYQVARQGYVELLERMAQPDHAGLDESRYLFIKLSVMYAVGMIDASLGTASALQWASEIEENSAFRVNAHRIRLVYYLRQGDTERSEQSKKQIELLQIQNSPIQYFEGTHLFTEALVYSSSDDLMRMKQTLSEIEKMAEQFPTWRPILSYARGEYQRLRGDYQSAMMAFREALQAAAPGDHTAWPCSAGSLIQVLVDLERIPEAVRQGREFLQLGEANGLGIICNYIKRPLALAEAAAGQFEEAVRHADEVIDSYRAIDATGINLGTSLENRARVALCMADEEAFRTHARLCSDQYRIGKNTSLTARYDKLVADARAAKLFVWEELGLDTGNTALEGPEKAAAIADMLTDCQGPRERAEVALQILVEQSGAWGGFLYTIQRDGPSLSATSGEQPTPADLDPMVERYLSAEIEAGEEVTMTSYDRETPADMKSDWSGYGGGLLRPLLLNHNTDHGQAITGIAVLVLEPGREFRFPGEAIASVSKSLLDAGDVATVYTA